MKIFLIILFLIFAPDAKNFIQICPKEMIDKIENPITLKMKEKEVG